MSSSVHSVSPRSSGPSPRVRLARRVACVAAAVRVPVVLAALYLWRAPLVAAVERHVGIEPLTILVFAVWSTPLVRLIGALVMAAALGACFLLASRHRPWTAYAATVGTGVLVLAVSSAYVSVAAWMLPLAGLILATNLLPAVLTAGPARHRGLWTTVLTMGLGLAEVFVLGRYLRWLGSLWRGDDTSRREDVARGPSRAALAGSCLLASGLAAAAWDGPALLAAEQALRMPGSVRIVARGDINHLAVGADGRCLFASGGGLDRLRCYRLDDPAQPPIDSEAETGGAENFAYDRAGGRLFSFNRNTRTLLSFDAATLALTHSVTGLDVSPGDSSLVYEPRTSTITIASETNDVTGTPIWVVDSATGDVVAQRSEPDASNVLVHPERPTLFLSFFALQTWRQPHLNGIIAYDLQQGEVTGRALSDQRVERSAFWRRGRQLLVTAPADARVFRLDADTLETVGVIDTMLGVRPIAVDEGRNLLLLGSSAEGRVVVIDLTSGEQRASYYLGSWLRSLVLREERAIAYVSSYGAIYEIDYSAAAPD